MSTREIHPTRWRRHGDATTPYATLTAAPSSSSDGLAIVDLRDEYARLAIGHTAAGAHSFTIHVWGYKSTSYANETSVEVSTSAKWCHIGSYEVDVAVGTEAWEVHQMRGITCFDRIYFQAADKVGTPTIYTELG